MRGWRSDVCSSDRPVFAATEINVTPAGRDLLFKLGIAPAVDTDVDPRAMAVGDALAQPGVLFQAMHIVVIRTVDVLVTQLQVERRHAIGQYRLQTWCQQGDNDVRRDRFGRSEERRVGKEGVSRCRY